MQEKGRTTTHSIRTTSLFLILITPLSLNYSALASDSVCSSYLKFHVPAAKNVKKLHHCWALTLHPISVIPDIIKHICIPDSGDSRLLHRWRWERNKMRVSDFRRS